MGKTLGKGATGRVFLATNVNTNQKAAVKIVSKASLANDTTTEDQDEQDCDSAGLSYGIEREIIIMKLLNHKNVLRLYDVWETEKALYLVLEYVEGGELFDLLVDSGPLPEQTAVDFFRQIILGAAYCHNLGICHRDLKPENILLDKDLNVKIADFGMAALESGRLLETSCGSPHYAAPEIVSGLHYHGSESDVWSCGVILFALLTGRLPFDDDNIRDLLLKVQVGKYEIVEDLSPEAIDLIHQMLTVNPEDRIKTKDILKHPFIRRYYNCEEDESFNQLPSPECALTPVKSRQEIDKRILENLVILWHGRSAESIVESLLSPESNSEKIFYSLLVRYRHDHAKSSNNIAGENKSNENNNDELVRSSSVISKAKDPLPSSSSSPARSSDSKKRLSITASTSSNRPISFTSRAKSRDSLQMRRISASSTQHLATSSPESVLKHKRASQAPFNQNGPASNRRDSLITVDTTPTKRKSLIPSEAASFNKMLSVSKSNTKMKRNSVTSKVLSAYAKMEEYEKTKKSADDYGKRTSSDFAALCDVLFGDESKIDTKIPNSDSMATINAIVFGNNKRKSAKIRQATSSRVKSIVRENNISKTRNSSNPAEKIAQLLNKKELNDFERRTASEFHTGANFNTVEPPKPISRLDPRYRAYETYQKRTSQHAAYLLKMQEEAELEAKAAAEIKAREEKLKKEQEELERLKNHHKSDNGSDLIDDTFNKYNELSSGTVLKKNDDYNNNFSFSQPKASKLKSNRYSTLSMYSTKGSSKRLSFYLKELDEEIAKNSEVKKKDRLSRLSMIITDPNAIQEEETPGLNIIHQDDSMNTLNEAADEDSTATDMDIHNEDHLMGKPRSASVTNELDDDLCFVPTQNISSYDIPVRKLEQPDTSNNISSGSSEYENLSELATKTVDIVPEVETKDTTKRVSKLPNIPGSPIKRAVKPVKSTNTFEIFEDAVRRSKQEFEDVQSKLTATSHNETPAQIEPENKAQSQPQSQPQPSQQQSQQQSHSNSKHLNQKSQENLNISKQREPLASKTDNKNTLNQPERKSSFFNKLSHTIQPSTERKSSFGKTIKSLFSGTALAPPQNLYTVLTDEDAFEALKTLLSGWQHYGVSNLSINSSRKILRAEIAKSNTMNVKSCKFFCIATNSDLGNSKITFTHEKGSSKSFELLVNEVRRILSNEDILVR